MLILSLAALLAGPATFGVAQTWPRVRAGFELVIMATIAVLVGVELAPLVVGDTPAAVPVILAGVLGLFGPTAVESTLHRIHYHRVEARAHVVTMLVGLLGLALHALADGAALTDAAGAGDRVLASAVVLHRAPVGVALWWLARPAFGAAVAWGVLGLIAASTVAGYAVGTRVIPTLTPGAVAAFQGFVAGSLLHVVFFRKHVHAHGHGANHS